MNHIVDFRGLGCICPQRGHYYVCSELLFIHQLCQAGDGYCCKRDLTDDAKPSKHLQKAGGQTFTFEGTGHTSSRGNISVRVSSTDGSTFIRVPRYIDFVTGTSRDNCTRCPYICPTRSSKALAGRRSSARGSEEVGDTE